MTISYEKDRAVFSDLVGVDDAEPLLAWLQESTSPHVDLSACTHLHPANLQVLMAARPTISAWPHDAGLAKWLTSALKI